jgi:hypothetical protein
MEALELLKALTNEIAIIKTYIIGSLSNQNNKKEWLGGNAIPPRKQAHFADTTNNGYFTLFTGQRQVLLQNK